MIPPISIDGTDITGLTIDGTDVEEITIDGQTVFSADEIPVAYSNLVAWYPFDSGFYGGTIESDVTALFNPSQSGDSTAYDGTTNASSTTGVTDINAGVNSGGLEFSGTDTFDLRNNLPSSVLGTSSRTMTAWIKDPSSGDQLLDSDFGGAGQRADWVLTNSEAKFSVFFGDARFDYVTSPFDGDWHHFAVTMPQNPDLDDIEMYQNGDSMNQTGGGSRSLDTINELLLGSHGGQNVFFDIDDFRFYDTKLSSSQIDQIYQNTEP